MPRKEIIDSLKKIREVRTIIEIDRYLKHEKYDFDMKKIMHEIDEHGGHYLGKLSKEEKANRTIVLYAVKKCGTALRYAPKELKSDFEIIKEAIIENKKAIEYVPRKLKNHPTVLKAILNYNKKSKNLEKYESIKKLKTPFSIITKTPEYYISDFGLAKLVLKANGMLIENLSKELKENRILTKIAINSTPYSLSVVHDKFKNDIEIVKLAMSLKPDSVQYVSNELKADYDFAIYSILLDGSTIQYFSEEIQKSFCHNLAVVYRISYYQKKGIDNLIHIHEKFKNDQLILKKVHIVMLRHKILIE